MKNLYSRGNTMKKKVIGIFICILIISTLIIPVAATTYNKEIKATSDEADLPIWEVGDEWTYNFIESIDYYPVTYYLSGDLTFEVMDDSGDSYILEAATRPDGVFDLGNFGLKTTILTTFSMSLQIRKADLGFESFREIIKGVLLMTIGPITLPIPLQVVANSYAEFDPPWIIIPFPLSDGKFGNLSGTEFVHVNNYMKLYWGLIPLLGPFNRSWPMTSVPYTCSEEQITVNGRTFDVFNVSAEWIEGSRFVSYYSEEVGNVAKEVIFIPYCGGGVRYSLNLELKEWSYTL